MGGALVGPSLFLDGVAFPLQSVLRVAVPPLLLVGGAANDIDKRKIITIATFKVARLTLQTRKLWLVGWSMSRPTVPRVTFDLP